MAEKVELLGWNGFHSLLIREGIEVAMIAGAPAHRQWE
jgi:hypothetical protein